MIKRSIKNILSTIIGEVNQTTFFLHKTYFKPKTHKTITSK